MKKILLFVVAAVLLPTGTASADLMVYEYVTGEKVTFDTLTGNYWYWNLNDFVNKTYGGQIDAIGDLGNYGGIAGGWDMASLSEMQALWTYSDTNIKASFGSAYDWSFASYGRYDYSPRLGYHRVAGISRGWFNWTWTEWQLDNYTSSALGAWVTTDATVVPAPPAVVLATTGMLTGLLCMLGAKLRGRRR